MHLDLSQKLRLITFMLLLLGVILQTAPRAAGPWSRYGNFLWPIASAIHSVLA
jgi:hypothetical protein